VKEYVAYDGDLAGKGILETLENDYIRRNDWIYFAVHEQEIRKVREWIPYAQSNPF